MSNTGNYRDQFDLPKELSYLNTAYKAPLLKSSKLAAMEKLDWLGDPSQMVVDDFFEPPQKLRKLFAKLIDCENPDSIALTPSCSYGMANVAAQLKPEKHHNLVIIDGQFPSNVYPWQRLQKQYGCELRLVNAPENGAQKGREWNERILAAIDANTYLVSLAPLFWADGTLFNLEDVKARTTDVGALLIVDGSQAIGAMPFSVRELKPDALVCAGYKWLFSPYGTGYAYYGDYFKDGIPIEENWLNREYSENFKDLVSLESKYREGGRRYSVGEHPSHLHVAMQLDGLQQVLEWTPESISQYGRTLFAPFEESFLKLGCELEDETYRASHLFGITFPEHMDITLLKAHLDSKRISVSLRGNSLRVSLHLFNSENDLARLYEEVKAWMGN